MLLPSAGMQPLSRARDRERALARDDGFSLIESLIACGVLAAGVLSVVQLFALSTMMGVSARVMTSASILAAQKLEELRTDTAPVSGGDRLDRFGAVVDDGSRRPMAFRRRWTVTPANGNLLVLAVSVWPYRAGASDDENGGTGAVRLTTLRAGVLP